MAAPNNPQRLRVLMLVFNQVNRGTYWRAFYLGRELARAGHQVSLIATSPQSKWSFREKMIDGVRVIESPDLLPGSLRSGWDPWNTLQRRKWIGNHTFDIVHAFESRPVVIYPALYACSREARLVMDWCDWFGKGGSLEERPNPLVRAVLGPVETYFETAYRGRAHAATVINHFLETWVQNLGVPANRTLLLRNGSDLTYPVMDRVEARALCGFAPEGTYIGFVGGTYTRDAHFMVEAFNRVLKTRPEARLVLAGSFNRKITALVSRPEAVIETGQTDFETIFRYLSACDVCWLPLRDSGANRGRLPLKLNDYMSAGRPVVSTAVGDLPALIEGYGMGVTTPDQPDLFAEATLRLLADPERIKTMGRLARQAAENELNWTVLASNLESLYMKLLKAEK